jgi:hypothetical protein
MLRALGILFGIIFVLIGIIGFMPSMSPADMLFGIFHVSALHNVIHLLAGLIALWTAFTSTRAVKGYFQIFGIVYLALGVLGFFYGDEDVLGFLSNNIPDAILHSLLGALFIYIGFGKKFQKS